MAGRRRNQNNDNSNGGQKKRPVADLYAIVPQVDADGKPRDPAFVQLCGLFETKGENDNLGGRVLSLPLNVLTGEPMQVLVQWRDEK